MPSGIFAVFSPNNREKVIAHGSMREAFLGSAEAILVILLVTIAPLPGHAANTVVQTINLPATDLAFSITNQTLYATVGRLGAALSNHVAALDPRTGQVQWSLPLAREPVRLDVSADGHHLFVGFDRTNQIVEVDTVSRQVTRSFSVASPFAGQTSAMEVRVHPTEPETIAVAYGTLFTATPNLFRLFRQGVTQTNIPFGTVGIPEFSLDGQKLFLRSYGSVAAYALTSDGLIATGPTRAIETGALRAGSDRLFGAGGPVLNADTFVKVGSHPMGPSLTGVALDESQGRAYLISSDFPIQLTAFDLATYRLTGIHRFTGLSGSPARLVSMDTNGLAFCLIGIAGKIVLVHPAFLASRYATDLALDFEPAPEFILGSGSEGQVVAVGVKYWLTVTNPGPAIATAVVITNTLPFTATSVAANVSTGAWQRTGSLFTWSIPQLPPGASATASIEARGGNITAYSSVTAGVTAAEDDPDVTNNQATHLWRSAAVATRQIPLLANDLLADDAAQRLYVTVPGRSGFRGNSVVIIDPFTGRLEDTVYAGSEPVRLAPTGTNGQVLVELSGADTNLVRLDLAAHEIIEATTGASLARTPGHIDESAGRFYSLFQDPAYPGSLRIVVSDLQTGVRVAERPLFQLTGHATRLTRWGNSGLAFLNANGSPPSIFLVRDGVIVPRPSVDLSVELLTQPGPAMLGTNWTLTARVRNLGPTNAESPSILLLLPSDSLNLMSVVASSGSLVETNSHQIIYRWLSLAPGQTQELTLAFSPRFAGAFTVQAWAASLGKDFNYIDNTARLDSEVGFQLKPDQMAEARLRTRDLVYDSTRGLFYASVPAEGAVPPNRIVTIDPRTGLQTGSVAAGDNPGNLAVSDDGQYLYVVVTNDTVVRRFHLPDFQPDLEFLVGDDRPLGPLVAGQIAVPPHRPHSLAVARFQPQRSSSDRGIALFDDGTPLPATTQDGGAFRLRSLRDKSFPRRGRVFRSLDRGRGWFRPGAPLPGPRVLVLSRL